MTVLAVVLVPWMALTLSIFIKIIFLEVIKLVILKDRDI